MSTFQIYQRRSTASPDQSERASRESLMESIDGQADHLVVLIHGLWGNPSHLRYLSKQLREAYSQDQLHILVPKSNADNYTYDGIETGGERITNEIEQEIKKIEDKGTIVRKLSIIGYSLGGLLARYTVGMLYADGVFDRIKPINFTTFATPHLGVRTPLTGYGSQFWNVVGPRTLSKSGRQLFLVDDFRNTGRPLLAIMADPDSVFIHGLAAFEKKTLYANIINDKTVSYYTASIDSIDPFADLSAVNLNTIPGTDNVLLDPAHPVKKAEKRVVSFFPWLAETAATAVTSIPWIFFLTCMLPFGATFFLANSGIQSFRSARRIQLHESGETGVVFDKYRKAPFLLNQARNAVDKAYEQAATAVGGQTLSAPSHHEGADDTDGSAHSSTTLVGNEESHKSVNEVDTASMDSDPEDEWPTLALTKEQFEMIDSLNNVGFTKYRVHISKVRHSHAAIIVRISWRPNFGEGKVVVKHWVDGFVV